MSTEELCKTRYGLNVVIEARISSLIKIIQKHHPEFTKEDLRNYVYNIIEKYW